MNERNYNVFGMVKRLTPIILKTIPKAICFNIFLAMLHGLSWVLITISQQAFFDRVTQIVNGICSVKTVIIFLLLMGAAYLFCHSMNGISNTHSLYIEGIIRGMLQKRIHTKISRICAQDFEDNKKLDYINKANAGASNALDFVFVFKDLIGFYLPYFIFLSVYLYLKQPILAISVVLVFIPTIITQIVRAKIYTDLENTIAPLRRKEDYIGSCMVGRDFYKETRILGGFTYFSKLYNSVLDLRLEKQYIANKKSNTLELCMRLLTVLGFFGILMLLLNAFIKRQISVGVFAAVYNSIGIMFSTMEDVVFSQFGMIANEFGSIRNYIDFLNLEEEHCETQFEEVNGDILVESVNFRYPNTQDDVLKNINLHIKEGETVAIVGENGSGKSTLVRLLTGMYKPTSGKVLIGNIDLCKISNKEKYSQTSGIFQNYQRYQMSLEKNLRISNLNQDYTEDELKTLCNVSGVELDQEVYPDGLNTMLSREFDGVDISGGQWQRVAIARGIYRKHNRIVLDEPTSAIDPMEEMRIYNTFQKISKGKTTIIVTHRLGAVKNANHIIVLKNGQVVEQGTHETLLDKNQEYARLFHSQEQWYVVN